MAKNTRLVLEIEDLHWIDPTSEEWLATLVERLVSAPILLLVSYRSGCQPPWLAKSYATQLALQRLTEDESQRIIRTVLPPQLLSSAYREAIAHCTKGLEILRLLPDTPARARYELGLQRTLAGALLATRGIGAPEVGPVRLRVRALCEQVGDDEQLCRALLGLTGFYNVRGELWVAHETAAQALRLAQGQSDMWLLFRAHLMMGLVLLFLGELVVARTPLEHALTLWDPHEPTSLPPHTEQDSVGSCFAHLAQTLGLLGYPDQALQHAYTALQRAQDVSHPYSVAYALVHVTWLHQLRREVHATRQAAEAILSVCEEQDFSLWMAYRRFCRGWALCAQEQGEEGLALLHHGIS